MPQHMPTLATPARPCKSNSWWNQGNLLMNPRGMAPVAHVLFNRFMKFNPKNPKWLNRDRFVLS